MLGNLFLAFVAAVAFATIVAVVAGLVLAAASAMAHDLWVGVIRGEHVHAAGAGEGGPRLDGDRRRDGHHDRHRGQGTERGASGGARVRGGVVGELPVRAADAVLEAVQHRRHRAGHDRRHADGDRPRAGVAQHDLPASWSRRRRRRSSMRPPSPNRKLEADLAAATDDAAKVKVAKAIADPRQGRRRGKGQSREIQGRGNQPRGSGQAAGSSCATPACIRFRSASSR